MSASIIDAKLVNGANSFGFINACQAGDVYIWSNFTQLSASGGTWINATVHGQTLSFPMNAVYQRSNIVTLTHKWIHEVWSLVVTQEMADDMGAGFGFSFAGSGVSPIIGSEAHFLLRMSEGPVTAVTGTSTPAYNTNSGAALPLAVTTALAVNTVDQIEFVHLIARAAGASSMTWDSSSQTESLSFIGSDFDDAGDFTSTAAMTSETLASIAAQPRSWLLSAVGASTADYRASVGYGLTFSTTPVTPPPADVEGGGLVYERRHTTSKALPYELTTRTLEGVPWHETIDP